MYLNHLPVTASVNKNIFLFFLTCRVYSIFSNIDKKSNIKNYEKKVTFLMVFGMINILSGTLFLAFYRIKKESDKNENSSFNTLL